MLRNLFYSVSSIDSLESIHLAISPHFYSDCLKVSDLLVVKLSRFTLSSFNPDVNYNGNAPRLWHSLRLWFML